MIFLGKPVEYWIGLQKEILSKGIEEYLEEIIYLRGKISLYEAKIQQLVDIKNCNNTKTKKSAN